MFPLLFFIGCQIVGGGQFFLLHFICSKIPNVVCHNLNKRGYRKQSDPGTNYVSTRSEHPYMSYFRGWNIAEIRRINLPIPPLPSVINESILSQMIGAFFCFGTAITLPFCILDVLSTTTSGQIDVMVSQRTYGASFYGSKGKVG